MITRACSQMLPPPGSQYICLSFVHLPQWCPSSDCGAYLSLSFTKSSSAQSSNTKMQGERVCIVTGGQTSTTWTLQLMCSLVTAVCIGIDHNCCSYLTTWCPQLYTVHMSQSHICTFLITCWLAMSLKHRSGWTALMLCKSTVLSACWLLGVARVVSVAHSLQ